MKRKPSLMAVAIMLTATFYLTSCGQQSQDSNENDQEEHGGEHSHDDDSGSSHDHDAHEHGGGDDMTVGEATTWIPAGNAAEAIATDFHFIVGSIDDLAAEITTDESEASILKLSPSGNPASFVFHNKFGNVGVSVSLKRGDFEGDIKIVHHAKDAGTYEFISINGSQMKLGRLVEGKETIFDEASFEDGDWLTLKASAAGSHYKGYMGNKNTTHGHGEEMEAGYVGIMIAGTGTVQIKQIEVTPIEAE